MYNFFLKLQNKNVDYFTYLSLYICNTKKKLILQTIKIDSFLFKPLDLNRYGYLTNYKMIKHVNYGLI